MEERGREGGEGEEGKGKGEYTTIGIYKISLIYNVSYACCDWSVTVLISGYANMVVTSQHDFPSLIL